MKYSRGRLDGSTADEWLYGRRLGASALALSVASYLVMRIVMMAAIEVATGCYPVVTPVRGPLNIEPRYQ
jgi:hypothetical protein